MTTQAGNSIHEPLNHEFLGWGSERHYKSVIKCVPFFITDVLLNQASAFQEFVYACVFGIIWTLNCPDYHREICIYVVMQVWNHRGLKKRNTAFFFLLQGWFLYFNYKLSSDTVISSFQTIRKPEDRQANGLKEPTNSVRCFQAPFLHKAPLSPYWQVKCCQVNIQICLW